MEGLVRVRGGHHAIHDLTHVMIGGSILNARLCRTLGNGILERSVARQGESSDSRDS